jgi:DUF177 domain-containing protein
MKKLPVLTVPVERITWEGLDVPVSLTADWFAPWLKEQPGLDFSLEKPIVGNVHLERHDDSILVRGRLQGELHLICSRCLDPFNEPLDCTFDLLIRTGRAPAPSPDMELDAAELDEDYFQGDELDLNVLLREQILLALPLKPLCQEDCRGLCRLCGANLKRESCSCVAPGFNASFAALQKLKID